MKKSKTDAEQTEHDSNPRGTSSEQGEAVSVRDTPGARETAKRFQDYLDPEKDEFKELRRYAFHLTRSLEAAYDIMASLRSRIAKRDYPAEVFSPEHVKASLYTTVRNLACDWCKGNALRAGTVLFYSDLSELPEAKVPGPEETFSSWTAEHRELLTPLLSHLNEPRLSIIYMILNGMDISEIATCLQLEESQVKSEKALAVRVLRRLVVRNGGGR